MRGALISKIRKYSRNMIKFYYQSLTFLFLIKKFIDINLFVGLKNNF